MEQVIVGGYDDDLNAGSTEWNRLNGGGSWNNDEDLRKQKVTTSGVIKNLCIKLQNAPGGGKSFTFTVRKNGANTSVVVVISGTSTQGETNLSVAVSADDNVSIQCVPSGTPTVGYAWWSSIFKGDNSRESLLLAGTAGTPDDTLTEWNNLTGGDAWRTPEARNNQVIPTNGVIKNFYYEVWNAPGVGKQFTFTLRVNGINSAISAVLAGANKKCNDTTNTVRVSPGDTVALQSVPNGTPTVSFSYWGFTFVADIDGESLIMCSSDYDNMPTAATEYGYINSFFDVWTGTETDNYRLSRVCVLKKFYVKLTGAAGAGRSYTLTIRKGGADTDLSVTIAGGVDTAGNNTTDTVSLSDFDQIDIECTPAGVLPVFQSAVWGIVCSTGTMSTLHLELGLGGYGNQGGRIPHMDNGLGLKRHPRSRLH